MKYQQDMGNVSDGFHTFNELYKHRAILFALICTQNPDNAWKSKQHSDGTMFDGMFIAGITTDEGHITYHCDNEFWDIFKIPEMIYAPKWDGHSPDDCCDRMCNLIKNNNGKLKSNNYKEDLNSKDITDGVTRSADEAEIVKYNINYAKEMLGIDNIILNEDNIVIDMLQCKLKICASHPNRDESLQALFHLIDDVLSVRPHIIKFIDDSSDKFYKFKESMEVCDGEN